MLNLFEIPGNNTFDNNFLPLKLIITCKDTILICLWQIVDTHFRHTWLYLVVLIEQVLLHGQKTGTHEHVSVTCL